MDESMLADELMPTLGELLDRAQKPPRRLTAEQELYWRTGYQNALSDLIALRWPEAAGGARQTAKEIEADDEVRVR